MAMPGSAQGEDQKSALEQYGVNLTEIATPRSVV
jgi:ATP-dependent Clp protease ATP-binding subunit ClpB